MPEVIESSSIPDQVSFTHWESHPLFEVDGVLAFLPLGEQDFQQLQLAARSGRPVAVIGPGSEDFPLEGQIKRFMEVTTADLRPLAEWYASAQRTNYRPIDCNFYDEFEAAIVTRRTVLLEYLGVDGHRRELSTKLRDTKTYLTEEYLQLENGSWLRFDRVYAVNGVPAGDSCRF
ncbi:hypothetical protein [Lewinella sp. W8]|uniref:hypothetical protein n=1 Tax=Lewinella sp. W8 TaxID=2528208 RepID=UPI0010683468|nr:hypothetical protein [Lewinella sp. W8]MTB53785.1 hypothetical protein [Lewinella sp. W8]